MTYQCFDYAAAKELSHIAFLFLDFFNLYATTLIFIQTVISRVLCTIKVTTKPLKLWSQNG